jgi:cysteine desulfurase/selenocysteine lyase
MEQLQIAELSANTARAREAVAPFAARTAEIRSDFPILQRRVGEAPLIYLDNGASSQKPEAVLQAMDSYYRRSNANVHRGVHTLSEEATALFEGARLKVARFINAPSERQIVFTRGTTEAINLVAQTWGRSTLKPGDEVLLTEMEHHSNIVPWQILQEQVGFTLRYIPMTMGGLLDLEAYEALLSERTRLVSFIHVSNVLGTINPAAEIIRKAHDAGALALVDGAQSVPHMPVDVQALDADFLVFSGHKMVGPTGVGVLYGKRNLLEAMPPWQGGGDMIREVTLQGSLWNSVPYKFEAGTPAIAEVIGLGAAVDYLSAVGMEWVDAHDRALVGYLYERLAEVEGVQILGPEAAQRSGLVSFTFGEVHPHDLSAILDRSGVAIRAGHHCAQPLHDKLDILASARASVYLYNSADEVDALIAGLEQAGSIFAF